jgi:hypothetical protein
MNQGPHLYNPSQPGTYTPYPPPQGSYPPYSVQKAVEFGEYPSEPIIYGQYESKPSIYVTFYCFICAFFYLNIFAFSCFRVNSSRNNAYRFFK